MDLNTGNVFDGSNTYTLQHIIDHFKDGYNNCSINDAVAYSTAGVFFKVNQTIKDELILHAPDNAKYFDGTLACSDEVQLIYSVDAYGETTLDVRVGIYKLFKMKHEFYVSTKYLAGHVKFALSDLYDESNNSFDILKGCMMAQVGDIEIRDLKTKDSVQSAFEHSFNSVSHQFVDRDSVSYIALLDPSPGSISRMTSIPVVELTKSPHVDVEAVAQRAEKTNKKILEHKDDPKKVYYLGFYDHALKPNRYMGFEINPYSRGFRSSGRVQTVTAVSDLGRYGHDVLYNRNGISILHHFSSHPDYYRYKTKCTVPFFKSHNKGFSSRLNDTYLFYSSDPFVPCFDHVIPNSGKRELFPIGLKDAPFYDKEEVVEVPSYDGTTRQIIFLTHMGKKVDLRSCLSFDSRRKLFSILIRALGEDIPDFKTLKPGMLEHPISGDLYERVKRGCTLKLSKYVVKLLDKKKAETHDVSSMFYCRYGDGKLEEIDKNTVLIPDISGSYRVGSIRIDDGGDYVTVKGIVPGSPIGFVSNTDGKRNYFSVIKGIRHACEFFEELQDYYQNCVWFKTFKYVYQDIISYKATDSLIVGEGLTFVNGMDVPIGVG